MLQLLSVSSLFLLFKGRNCTVEDVVVDIPSTVGEEIRGDSIGFECNGHNGDFIVYIAHLYLIAGSNISVITICSSVGYDSCPIIPHTD